MLWLVIIQRENGNTYEVDVEGDSIEEALANAIKDELQEGERIISCVEQ